MQSTLGQVQSANKHQQQQSAKLKTKIGKMKQMQHSRRGKRLQNQAKKHNEKCSLSAFVCMCVSFFQCLYIIRCTIYCCKLHFFNILCAINFIEFLLVSEFFIDLNGEFNIRVSPCSCVSRQPYVYYCFSASYYAGFIHANLWQLVVR